MDSKQMKLNELKALVRSWRREKSMAVARREVAHDNDAPDFTSATAEEGLKPSEMPSGQDNSILEKEGK